jgi:phage tail-like protein
VSEQTIIRTEPRGGWLVDQLPVAMAEDDFTRRFVGIFETIADSVRSRIDGVEHLLDTGLSPPETARWLAGWLGLTVPATLPVARQRALVRAAGTLLTWRGTARGLCELVEAYTGGGADVVDSGGVGRPGTTAGGTNRVTVRLSTAGGLSLDDLDALVRRELPPGTAVEIHLAEPPADHEDHA